MTRLINLTATAHPLGNRIDLKWEYPSSVVQMGIRVVRREGTHPVSPDDGVLVAEGEGMNAAVDENLRSETVYYYTLFPYSGSPPQYEFDRNNRVSAMATGQYDIAGQMYELLPGIYHRYDTVLSTSIPEGMSEEDQQRGQLRRFLDLPGNQFDQIYSFIKSSLDFHHLGRLDGQLLPLLAQWIGWKSDYTLEIETQRNEIRNAPDLYKRVGIIPTVEATVKRISGWKSRTKEFVHNVFLSNRPEQLNIWEQERSSTGEWTVPLEPLSLDFAYEGRPTLVRDTDDTLWLFYHTLKKGQWDIWHKTLVVFTVDPSFQDDLEKGSISQGMQVAFGDLGHPLSLSAKVKKIDDAWIIDDLDNGLRYHVKTEVGSLSVYKWSPSQPLISFPVFLFEMNSTLQSDLDSGTVSLDLQSTFSGEGYPVSLDATVQKNDGAWEINDLENQLKYDIELLNGVLNVYKSYPIEPRKDPSAVLWNGDISLFCESYDESTKKWRINYLNYGDGNWSTPDLPFLTPQVFDPSIERRHPFALVDDSDGLWLFWMEKGSSRWELKYNRHDGTSWQSATAVSFPLDAGADPRVGSDLFVVSRRNVASQRLWVFWARREPTGEPDQTRWQIAYRIKESLDPGDDADWSAINLLPKASPDYHDREPAGIVHEDGNIELFWCSNRNGSWSTWSNTLDTATNTWGTEEQVTTGPHSQRDPVPVAMDDKTMLIYRSNQSFPYSSEVFGTTETVDFRYGGSTTVHTRDAEKIALRGEFEDFQRYTYDTKREQTDWFARDTVGLYLTTDTIDADKIKSGITRLDKVLKEFMPITDRAVFITPTGLQTENVYTYGLPLSAESKFITESYEDQLSSVTEEEVVGPGEEIG